MSKRKFLCFSAASNTVSEDLHTSYCYWRYKSSKRALLCNSQYFCVVGSDVNLGKTHRMHRFFPLQQWLEERAAAFCYATLPVLFHNKYPNFGHFFHSLHPAALICRIARPLLPPATSMGET
jgi:hypothetical protein